MKDEHVKDIFPIPWRISMGIDSTKVGNIWLRLWRASVLETGLPTHRFALYDIIFEIFIGSIGKVGAYWPIEMSSDHATTPET